MSKPTDAQKPFCHCLRCGKNFYEHGEMSCGGTINGQPICSTEDVKREAERREEQRKVK